MDADALRARFATGGVIHGDGTSTPDCLRVSPGEQAMTREGVVYRFERYGDGYRWAPTGEQVDMTKTRDLLDSITTQTRST